MERGGGSVGFADAPASEGDLGKSASRKDTCHAEQEGMDRSISEGKSEESDVPIRS